MPAIWALRFNEGLQSNVPGADLALALVPSRIARADASGGGTFPGVPPGTYYLMVSAIYNKQSLVWGQPVHVNTGQNSITLDLRNATPLN